jgi:DNA invertase Pin-like site-specific DNA recombinase
MKYFGYIRVSTAKQGEQGVSLQEQRDAIARYSQQHGLEIANWFEERETAAKRGRPVFNQMLRLLKQGKADGVIIHKIDRSARNLKDWSDLGEMIDSGIQVHFVNESLDLHSRGGRLSADIQAVVAADYIRNLREETRKGFYGRIKQGLYPLPAPMGYLDTGKGKAKDPDPIRAPLIKKAFALYATGQYNLERLGNELATLGLRNRRGAPLSINGLSVILNNPFYIGLIRLKRTGETFPGVHVPLITKSLFDRVHQVLNGKVNVRTQRHAFLFRRLLQCRQCAYSLIGERQKGHVYYRCHTKDCKTAAVRQEPVELRIEESLQPLQFDERERAYLAPRLAKITAEWSVDTEDRTAALKLRVGQMQDRLTRLTDAYIDRVIEKDIFEERKGALLMERKLVEEQLATPVEPVPARLQKFLELAGDAYLLYKTALPEEKRDFLKIITSNRQASGRNVDITLAAPFDQVANRNKITYGAPYRDVPRTLDALLDNLTAWFKANPAASFEAPSALPDEDIGGEADITERHLAA